MYKVIKAKGYSENVIIENTDTLANITIGRFDIKIYNILKEAGYDVTEYTSRELNLTIDKETATKLARLAMKMKKPIRDQRKKVEDKPTEKVTTDIDAFDLIFGV